jgi:diguanylate cyclase (GGDEF)-like protein
VVVVWTALLLALAVSASTAAWGLGQRHGRRSARTDQLMLDSVDVGIAALDGQGRLARCNDALRALTDDVPGLVDELVGGDDHDRELRLADRGGTDRHLVVGHRREERDVVVVHDVTEVRQAEQRLRASEERFRRTFEGSPVGMALVAGRPRAVVAANAALTRFLHVRVGSLAGRPADDVLVCDDGRPVQAVAGTTAVELAFHRPDGTTGHGLVSQTVVDPEGLVLVQVEDVTERVQARLALAHQAAHDPLTGLANRRTVVEHLQVALTSDPEGVGLLFVDLDRFKQVNDAYGHDVGDQLLVEVAHRLESVVRSGDRVGRLGGDEFVVVCWPLGSAERLSDVASRVERAIAAPVHCGRTRVHVTASVGTTRARAGLLPEDLLREADTAMYRAKTRGRSRVEEYDASLRREVEEQVAVEALLRSALDSGAVELDYQPIVDSRTAAVVSVEALARLRTPTGEVVRPSRFIPVAESTGLVVPLGLAVLDAGLRQVAHWHSGGHRVRLAVNVSAGQVARADFEAAVSSALDRHGVAPEHLELEITESALVAAGASTLQQLLRLRDTGVRIAIDDYGTGHASLSYLHRLPATTVKVDASFVAGVPHDARATAIVRAVSRLAEDVGVDCVAEGVETGEQRDWLAEHAPRALLQGFLLARPRPAGLVALAPVPAQRTPATVTPLSRSAG